MKSTIETQERKLQAKMTAVSKLDEDYTKLQQQCEEVKSDVQKSVDSIIASIEAKKQTIFCSNGRPNQKVTWKYNNAKDRDRTSNRGDQIIIG